MNSTLKSILHFLATVVGFYVPTLVINSTWGGMNICALATHFGLADITVGTIVALGLNYILSHTVATTTGASAVQGVVAEKKGIL